MISRRTFLSGSAAGAAALLLPARNARGAYSPLDARAFPPLEAQTDRPWLGLATSLSDEHDYYAEVEGKLPPELRGTLYRNGPGLFDRGGQRKQCLLDGDGMIQAFDFEAGGRVRYRNRFTRTPKFVEEERRGRYCYATWTTRAPGGAFANLFGSAIRNQAGVSTVFKNGRLFAFDEAGAEGQSEPFELDPATLDTLGAASLAGQSEPGYYSAHPKTDARTGEWLHFGLEYSRQITLHLTTLRPDGTLASHRTWPMPRYCYIHDWFVTTRHQILNIHPAEVSLFPFLSGFASLAGAFRWKPERGNQLVIFERGSDAEPVIVETEAAWMWHALNAYERNGEIVADFVGYDDPDHFLGDDAFVWKIMSGSAGRQDVPGTLRRLVIDPQRKKVQSDTIAGGSSHEFPIVSPQRACHPHRYGYLARRGAKDVFWRELVRVDTETGRGDAYDFGEDRYVTEPIFAPASDATADRDDEPGWLLTEGYDGRAQKSFLAVLRADRVGDGPVALIHLRHHVPFNFHGHWQGAST